jgi:hypothetical protein
MPTCAACGQDNPEGFRFCGACGAPLAEAELPREARKTVTIVFTDVVSSTALGERVDPESMRRVMARYFDAMRLAVEETHADVESVAIDEDASFGRLRRRLSLVRIDLAKVGERSRRLPCGLVEPAVDPDRPRSAGGPDAGRRLVRAVRRDHRPGGRISLG